MSRADELRALGLDPEAPQLSPDEVERWLRALTAALRPDELPAAENQRLIELALEDPLAPPSNEELVESARLREALANGAAHGDAELLRALGAPFRDVASDEAALGAPQRIPASTTTNVKALRLGVVTRLGGAGLFLAAAAALALSFGWPPRHGEPEGAPFARALPRSTATLFTEPFDSNTTARVDRIASARERDLRDNRYAAWGVR